MVAQQAPDCMQQLKHNPLGITFLEIKQFREPLAKRWKILRKDSACQSRAEAIIT